MDQPLDSYLTIPEAASHIGVHRSVIRYYISRNYFSGASRLGRHWFVPRAEVEKFVRPRRGPKPRNNDPLTILVPVD